MAYTARVHEVMIASPSDVLKERQIVRDVISEWNAVHSADRQIVLLPTGWESHASPEMGDRPQGLINKQLLERADVLVAVFWTRIGSPTGEAPSGTVEEIERHLASGKPTLIYFSSAPVHPDSVDPEQYAALRAFRDDCRRRGLIEEYEDLVQFRVKLSRHLAQTVIRALSVDTGAELPEWESQPTTLPQLSSDAQALLLAAASDTSGVIMRLRSTAGLHIQTNNTDFVEGLNPRSEARWQAALDELIRESLVAQEGYEGSIFQVTHRGYEAADQIKRRTGAP